MLEERPGGSLLGRGPVVGTLREADVVCGVRRRADGAGRGGGGINDELEAFDAGVGYCRVVVTAGFGRKD